MVKHNNVVPNIHCKKKWHNSQRGPLKVKLALNQASKKKSRRLARAAKAAAIAPRPLQLLRPVVHAQTQRYSSKVRLGRGFTLAEIKAAGLTAAYARTVGIAVDHRRTNRSAEALERNVARLTEYKSQLVVIPKGAAGKEEAAAATQPTGILMPIVKPAAEIVMAEVTDEMKAATAFTTMRLARQETRVAGQRIAVENRKKKD